jgi:hypothetical protein
MEGPAPVCSVQREPLLRGTRRIETAMMGMDISTEIVTGLIATTDGTVTETTAAETATEIVIVAGTETMTVMTIGVAVGTVAGIANQRC